MRCSFDASRSTDDVGITSYAWTFGDGLSASTTQPKTTHRYPGPLTYTVILTVTDAGGLTSSTSMTVKFGR